MAGTKWSVKIEEVERDAWVVYDKDGTYHFDESQKGCIEWCNERNAEWEIVV